MNICQSLANISDMARSTAIVKAYANGYWRFVNAMDHDKFRVYFIKRKIAGFHLWQPSDLLGFHIAMSGALFSRIFELGGMDTISMLRIEEV